MRKIFLFVLGLLMTLGAQTAKAAGCSAPTNAQVSNITTNTAVLTWTPGAGQSQWHVRITDISSVNPNSPTAYNVDEPYCEIIVLRPNTSYWVQVWTICSEEEWSTDYAQTTFTTPLPNCTPTNFQVSNITGTSATFSWTATSDCPSQWQVHLYNGSVVQKYTANTNSYTITLLQPNTSYLAKVRAVYGYDSYGDWSSEIEFSTPAIPVYTVFNNGTLTYYYDEEMDSRTGIKELYDGTNPGMRFTSYNTQVTKAVIDPSMINAPLTSLNSMFYGGSHRTETYPLSNLTSISELDNLYNMEGLTDLTQMFFGCRSLTSVDLTGIKFSSVKKVLEMFSGCTSLKTIYCREDWNTYTSMANAEIFNNCSSLVGANGTLWDASHITKEYARPDKPGQPGYFTAKTQGIDEIVNRQSTNRKFIRNGQLFIEINGRTYDATGKEVK